MSDKLVLIDGNSLAYRAFYAIPMLSNSQGFITNAIYGFCNMLFKVLEDENPGYLAIAFDKGKVVFRHGEYEEYKATRKPMPDELRPQLPVLKELLRAMNIALFECEGYEADDLIGTLARLGEEEEMDVLIVTGDRDSLQLVSPKTKVLLTRKGISEMDKYDEKALWEKYGLLPEQIIDLKGLMGDSSDNIPGIPGVGEKTALKLLHEYRNVENVLAHYADFAGKKLGQLLEQYTDQARMSRQLAVIERNVPLDYSREDLRVIEPDYPRLLAMLRELEFKNILQKMMEKAQANQVTKTVKAEGILVDDPEVLKAHLPAGLESDLTLHLATEKDGPVSLRITELGIKTKDLSLWLAWTTEADLNAILAVLRPYVESEGLKKTVHDAKSALLAFQSYGIEIRGIKYDTLLMAYLLNPSRAQTDLAALARDYFGIGIHTDNMMERGFIYLEVMEKLAAAFAEELREQEMWSLFHDLELPLSAVLAKMELTGVLLDKKVLQDMGRELDARIEVLTARIYDLAGEGFNINSPKQLGEILFEKLSLPRGKKTKTGYSTSADVLETLAPEHEIVEQILHYRQLVKIKTTYIDGLEALRDPETGKVHTSFNQTVTATGRLSSTEPNLQNIPIRMEEGRQLRKAFLPLPGHRLLSADYSQFELRVLAHIARDEVLLEAFHEDQDIHTRTASEVFGVRMENVSKEMRRAAKAVNFGIVYGISDYGLSQDLRIPRSEAKVYIDNYFRRYRGVKLYIDRVIAEAREKGYVTTLLNRRRYLPDILSRNYHLRGFAERTAMNTPIQGSAADIIKLAMLKLHSLLEEGKSGSQMILQVHDELIFTVPDAQVKQMGRVVAEVMSGVYPLVVPLKVDLQSGLNWYERKPLVI